MIDLVALPPVLQGVAVVGVIIVQAVVLYLGYGAVERYLAEPMIDTIEDA